MIIEMDQSGNYHWDLLACDTIGATTFWDKFLDAMAELPVEIHSTASPFKISIKPIDLDAYHA